MLCSRCHTVLCTPGGDPCGDQPRIAWRVYFAYTNLSILTSPHLASPLEHNNNKHSHSHQFLIEEKRTKKKMARPLLSRKPDLCLLIFFCLHTFFVTGIDCLDLYPTAIHNFPPFPHLLQLRQFYIDTYQDKFLSATSPAQPWFVACTWMEFVYHVPTCLWAVWGLYSGIFPPSFTCITFKRSNIYIYINKIE